MRLFEGAGCRWDGFWKWLKLEDISPGDVIRDKVHKEIGICNKIGLGNAGTTFCGNFSPKMSSVDFSRGILRCFRREFFGSILIQGDGPAAPWHHVVQPEGCSGASAPSPQPGRHPSSLPSIHRVWI